MEGKKKLLTLKDRDIESDEIVWQGEYFLSTSKHTKMAFLEWDRSAMGANGLVISQLFTNKKNPAQLAWGSANCAEMVSKKAFSFER